MSFNLKIETSSTPTRITLRAGRNKLYESIKNQNRPSSQLRHAPKYRTVSSVCRTIAYTTRNIIQISLFNNVIVLGQFQLLQCSKSNSTTNFATREASRIYFIMNKRNLKFIKYDTHMSSKFSFWAGDVLIIQPSLEALALHTLINLPKLDGKNPKPQNEHIKHLEV